ncbi:hypothetical protein CQW23_14388 [Capsicum baccatum]|uniref:Transposase-associated domain-containing protein n=1 Tax=Capsicum baccatum TaxID=33114 RepID=A0A2G2WJB0_CAPBA|nr:hypothetical protein CQW23_14388 [Capsicum baccatum]
MNNSDHEWMYDRLLEDGFINPKFIDGFESFVEFAKSYPECMDGEKLRCPCNHRPSVCDNNQEEVSASGETGYSQSHNVFRAMNMSDTPSLVVGSSDTPDSIDISIGPGSSLSTTRWLVISVVGEKFVPNGHSISKTITENFKEQQDATGYTWRGVTESTHKFYWHEFMWNPTENSIIEHIWKKVTSNLYTKRTYNWRRQINKPNFVLDDVWQSWKTYWASDEFKNKSHIATQNRCSETGGSGTGPSKHTRGSRSTVEHTIKLVTEIGRELNSWEIFKKLHQKKNDSFVDAKSKSINMVCNVQMAQQDRFSQESRTLMM